MKAVLMAVGVLLIVLTLMSRIRSAIWWIRGADFPRLQIAAGLAATLLAYAAIYGIGTSAQRGNLATAEHSSDQERLADAWARGSGQTAPRSRALKGRDSGL